MQLLSQSKSFQLTFSLESVLKMLKRLKMLKTNIEDVEEIEDSSKTLNYEIGIKKILLKERRRNKRMRKILSTLLIALVFFGTMMMVPTAFAQTKAIIRFTTSEGDCPVELGDETAHTDIIGTTFDVAMVVEKAADLYGLDIEIKWDLSYIEYVPTHTVGTPWNANQAVMPPSPYAGILYSGGMQVKDVVDETGGISGATDPTSMGWWVYTSMSPAPSFYGNGTVVVLTFRVTDQPYDNVEPTGVDFNITITASELSDSTGFPLPGGWDANDCSIHLWPRTFEYPPVPMLKVLPEEVEGLPVCTNFESSVWLMDENENDLSPFWDISGFDMVLNFDPGLIQALDVDVDPDQWWGGNYPTTFYDSTFVIYDDIDNTAGTIHVAFLGIPTAAGEHIAPFGKGRLFNVTFHVIYESTTYPPNSTRIWLENPLPTTTPLILDSDGSLIDLNDPVSTTWHQIYPAGGYCTRYHLDSCDGKLEESKQIQMTQLATGKYREYHVDKVTVTLNLTMKPYRGFEDYVWAASFGPDNLGYNGLPGRFIGTDDPYDGFGVPNWTGNFSIPGVGLSSVNQINVTCLPFTPDNYTYTLTAGVDYKVYPDEDKIELLTPVDVQIINEHWTDGVDNVLCGWPWINYVASGIQDVRVHFPNCTTRMGRNTGYAKPPPSEWWYDPDWAWELEGWWALGYFGGPCTWPDGSEWWINYTAASYLTIDYMADPDPRYYFMEFEGSYDDFFTTTEWNCTQWHEIYPWYSRNWHLDEGVVDICEQIWMTLKGTTTRREYHINDISTDIWLTLKPCVCGRDLACQFYCWKRIVEVAGFPHPERDYCPWHSQDSSVPLPHKVESATFEAPFKPPGAWIDLYVCGGDYQPLYSGLGPDEPSDIVWPQKEVCLCALVTYNFWPEQNKDVVFTIIDNWGDIYARLYDRTDADGIAMVCFRMPWMCDDPEYYLGEWCVVAEVDVACECINDTLCFKYDYLVNIWDVSTDEEAYKHCDVIEITVEYGSYAMQDFDIIITVTVVDETGVPFGYAETQITIGGAEYCRYKDGIWITYIHVPKWARAGEGKIYVGALDSRGNPISPLYTPVPTIGILAE